MLRSPDTDPRAHRAQLEIYRRMSGAERFAVASALSDAAQRIMLDGIRARHPEYTEREAILARARVNLGDELFRRAWPDEPRPDPGAAEQRRTSVDDAFTAFLTALVHAFEQARCGYMISGSVASSYHGVARATNDIDIVLDLAEDGLDRLHALFPADSFLFDRAWAADAVRRGKGFQIIAMQTGQKADCLPLRSRPFSRSEFARQIRVQLAGVEVSLSTPEDTILAKLEWARRGASERQLRDVAGILSVQDHLDHTYIERWATELGVEPLWRRVQAET